MKGNSHNSISVVEGFFNSISMMNIDIKIENPRVDLQQLKDADNDIVDVAEPTCLGLFGVMVASSPVDRDIRNTSHDDVSGIDAPACRQLAEMIKPIKAWAIKALVDLEQLLEFKIISDLPLLILLVLRNNLILLASHPFLEVLDIRLIMEKTQFLLTSLLALKHHQMVTEFIALDERMRHLDTLGLHGVLLAEVVIGDRLVVKVAYLSHIIKFIELQSSSAFISHTHIILMQSDNSLYPNEDDHHMIVVNVSNPIEKKSALSTYTVYSVKGTDKHGEFDHEKRYSDFDHVRSYLVARWPGCFVPPLPIKKMIGNSDVSFVQERRRGLATFAQQVSKLKHLWYSKEFQTFLRSSGEIEKQLKQLPHENHEDIIKKYDEIFPHLGSKIEDTIVLGRVLEFSNYIKKILPVLGNFKEMALSFIQAKNANSEQFTVLLNYVLPQYEKSCLSVYCNQITEGKYIFNESNDQRLAGLVAKLKELMTNLQFQELYFNLEQEEREVEAFLETYKGKDYYQQKYKDLKSDEKDLQLELVKLNAGKQGVFAGFRGSLESNKQKATKKLQAVKEDIKVYEFLVKLIVLLMGYYEIDRFKKDKLNLYFETIKKIAMFQKEFNTIKGEICTHVLENHNLL